MHNSNNFINRDDPLVGSVQKVMKENQIRREVEKSLNEELGIYSKKVLPFELHSSYDSVLEESVQATLSEEGKIQIIDKKGFMNALKKGKKSEKKESEKEYGVDAEREMASKKKGMYEQDGSTPSTPKEKVLAAKHGNPRVITKGDVLAARGVIKGSNMEEEKLEEKAPPGAKYERMVKHIKKGYSKDGLTDKEKAIAYATAWKSKKSEKLDEVSVMPAGAQQAIAARAQQKAANDLQTQRMTAREPSAPAPKPEPSFVDNAINTVKRAAADTATAVLGPERSAQLQAAVKGTDPAKERAQETEKAQIAAGSAQRFPTAADRAAAEPKVPQAARNEPVAPKAPPKPVSDTDVMNSAEYKAALKSVGGEQGARKIGVGQDVAGLGKFAKGETIMSKVRAKLAAARASGG